MRSIKKNDVEIFYNTQKEFWDSVEIGSWEKDLFGYIDKCVVEKGVFIDIGSWNGVASIYAAKKGAFCIAYEPDKIAYEILINNIKINKLEDKIIAFNKAISNKEFSTLRTIGGEGNSMSSTIERDGDIKAYEVESVCVKDIINNTPFNFSDIFMIKIDIEGAEEDILKDLKFILDNNKISLYISIHSFWLTDKKRFIKDMKDTLLYRFKKRSKGIIEGINNNKYLELFFRS